MDSFENQFFTNHPLFHATLSTKIRIYQFHDDPFVWISGGVVFAGPNALAERFGSKSSHIGKHQRTHRER
jgi:hypothetical protein